MCLTLPTNCNRQSNLSTWSSYRALVQGTRAKAPAKSSIRWWRYIRVKCDRLEGKAWKDQSHKQTDDPHSITTERWRSNPDLMRFYDKQEYCTAPELMNENTFRENLSSRQHKHRHYFHCTDRERMMIRLFVGNFSSTRWQKICEKLKNWNVFIFWTSKVCTVLILFFVIVICDSSH